MATHQAHPGSEDGGLQNSYGLEMAASEYNASYGPQMVPLNAPEAVHEHYYAGQNSAYAQQNAKNESQRSALTPSAVEKTKKILGFRLSVFWLSVGGAVLLVLGIALGVGLGVGLSQRNLKSSSSSSSSTAGMSSSLSAASAKGQPTTTASSSDQAQAISTPTKSSTTSTTVSSAPVTSGTTGLSANSCTYTTPRTYRSDSGTSFTEYCFTDWPNNEEAADGNGTVKDIHYTTVYTFEACMEKCVLWNTDMSSEISGGEASKCAAITYNSNLTSIIAVGKQGGNCFLKNVKGVDRQGSAESSCAAIVY